MPGVSRPAGRRRRLVLGSAVELPLADVTTRRLTLVGDFEREPVPLSVHLPDAASHTFEITKRLRGGGGRDQSIRRSCAGTS